MVLLQVSFLELAASGALLFKGFIMEYLIDLYVLATSIVTIASVICNYTDTPKDDAFVAKAYRILEQFAFLGGKAKQ